MPSISIIGSLALVFGIIVGYILRHYVALARHGTLERETEELLLEALKKANKIEAESLLRAKGGDEALTERRKEFRMEEKELKDRLARQEERLDRKEDNLNQADEMLRKELEEVRIKANTLALVAKKLEEKEQSVDKNIENIAGISKIEATALILEKAEHEAETDIQSRVLKLVRDGEERFENKAREIITSAIYRIGNAGVASFTTSQVEIENEEIKGKIIGKEGRNIKTFERVAGVDLLVDEGPNLLVVSCFDPVRRAIATNALEMLIKDGRIQPAKIEECLEKAKREIGLFMKKKGEEAVLECSLVGIPDALIPLIGRLYFRTSFGQNILNHSIEMAHIAGIIAGELGADVRISRAGALLHDIGKAVDHEIQGTHVEIGRRILAKYNVDDRIIKAMQSHHEEYPYETTESVIVQVADAISGGRPGARRDTVDRYIERLSELEAIAMTFQGIEKAYALQAGREIRVFVTPALVSDLEAHNLARDIALRVEKELRYPGEIKINVIRESRSIEFAR